MAGAPLFRVVSSAGVFHVPVEPRHIVDFEAEHGINAVEMFNGDLSLTLLYQLAHACCLSAGVPVGIDFRAWVGTLRHVELRDSIEEADDAGVATQAR